MAKQKSGETKKLMLVLAVPGLFISYQVASPYFAETTKIIAEVEKTLKQIKQVKGDALLFSDDWEQKNAEKEREIAQVLPDQIMPSEVLRYFATGFEKDHPGVQFTSLMPAPPTQSSVSADKDNPNVKARISKVQIKAKMPAEHMLAYLEYVEKYPGLSRVAEVNFTSQNDGKSTALDIEMSVELYLVPKDWLKKEPEKKEASEQRSTATAASLSGTGWFELGNIDQDEQKAEDLAKEEVPPEPPKKILPPKPPKFHISQFVGSGVVIGEDLFEEGDHVQGWSILKVDPKGKTVIIRNGKTLYKVVVK